MVQLAPPNNLAAKGQTQVFVDRACPTILTSIDGEIRVAAEIFQAVSHPLHGSLMLGRFGEVIVFLTGLILPLSFVLGVLLWPQQERLAELLRSDRRKPSTGDLLKPRGLEPWRGNCSRGILPRCKPEALGTVDRARLVRLVPYAAAIGVLVALVAFVAFPAVDLDVVELWSRAAGFAQAKWQRLFSPRCSDRASFTGSGEYSFYAGKGRPFLWCFSGAAHPQWWMLPRSSSSS